MSNSQVAQLNELLGRVQQRRHSVTSQPMFPEPSQVMARVPEPSRSDSYSSIAEAIAAQEDSISEFREITEDVPMDEGDSGHLLLPIPSASKALDDTKETVAEIQDSGLMPGGSRAVRVMPAMTELSSEKHQVIEPASVAPPSVPIASVVGENVDLEHPTFGMLITKALSLEPRKP